MTKPSETIFEDVNEKIFGSTSEASRFLSLQLHANLADADDKIIVLNIKAPLRASDAKIPNGAAAKAIKALIIFKSITATHQRIMFVKNENLKIFMRLKLIKNGFAKISNYVEDFLTCNFETMKIRGQSLFEYVRIMVK
jgi:hypothetical protein